MTEEQITAYHSMLEQIASYPLTPEQAVPHQLNENQLAIQESFHEQGKNRTSSDSRAVKLLMQGIIS
jgi:hypothetical protein